MATSNAETKIYVQGLLMYFPSRDVDSKWYMFTDSDLKPYSSWDECYADSNCGGDEGHRKKCDLHSSGILKTKSEEAKCKCGNFHPYFSNSAPNAVGSSAVIADGSTVYMIGGVYYGLRHAQFSASRIQHTSYDLHSFASKEVYRKDFAAPETEWEELQGVELIKKNRTQHHPVLLHGKIYVFGTVMRLIVECSNGVWYPWAEVLNITPSAGTSDESQWKPISNPNDQVGDQGLIVAHTISISDDGREEILLYSGTTERIVAYDPTHDTWACRHKIGFKFLAATFMDGILYGMLLRDRYPELDQRVVYYYDYESPRQGKSLELKPLLSISDTPGIILASGLIAVGNDTLYIVSGYEMYPPYSSSLFRIFIRKCKITKHRNDSNGEVNVTAKIVSRAMFCLRDAYCIHSCIAL